MILTLDEIVDINQNAEFDSAIGYARAIESAVIEKLKAQEPVAWLTEDKQDGEIGMDVEGSPATPGWTESFPVYRHPLPPADVVRDAERLDWLMNSGRIVICDRDGCYTYTHTSGRYGPVAKTQREAIDLAMAETR